VLRLYVAHLRGDARRPHEGHYSDALQARLAAGEKFIVLPLAADGAPLRRTIVELADVTAGLAAMVGNEAAMEKTFHLSGPAFRYDGPCEHLAGKLDLPIEKVTVPGAYPFSIDTSLTTDLLGWEPTFDVIASIDAALARLG